MFEAFYHHSSCDRTYVTPPLTLHIFHLYHFQKYYYNLFSFFSLTLLKCFLIEPSLMCRSSEVTFYTFNSRVKVRECNHFYNAQVPRVFPDNFLYQKCLPRNNVCQEILHGEFSECQTRHCNIQSGH